MSIRLCALVLLGEHIQIHGWHPSSAKRNLPSARRAKETTRSLIVSVQPLLLMNPAQQQQQQQLLCLWTFMQKIETKKNVSWRQRNVSLPDLYCKSVKKKSLSARILSPGHLEILCWASALAALTFELLLQTISNAAATHINSKWNYIIRCAFLGM
jgi:hypothetical protein